MWPLLSQELCYLADHGNLVWGWFGDDIRSVFFGMILFFWERYPVRASFLQCFGKYSETWTCIPMYLRKVVCNRCSNFMFFCTYLTKGPTQFSRWTFFFFGWFQINVLKPRFQIKMLSLRKACKEFGGFWTHGGGGRNQTQEPEKKKEITSRFVFPHLPGEGC